ncbi:MAG: hypothetical protein HOY79_15945 [Streptomyces sp.]|nr:hypothetical protein [Streptomyces sp.]
MATSPVPHHQLGELVLEVAPACLFDIVAAAVFTSPCEEIGETVKRPLAAHRCVMSCDRRALRGIVL